VYCPKRLGEIENAGGNPPESDGGVARIFVAAGRVCDALLTLEVERLVRRPEDVLRVDGDQLDVHSDDHRARANTSCVDRSPGPLCADPPS